MVCLAATEMRLLLTLFLALLLDFVHGSYAPYMEKDSSWTLLPPEKIRGCTHQKVEVYKAGAALTDVDKIGFKCNVANGLILNAKSENIADVWADSLSQYTCATNDNQKKKDQICAGAAIKPKAGEKGFVFTDSNEGPLGTNEISAAGNVELAVRFPRDDGLKKHQASAYVRAMHNFIPRNKDHHNNDAPYFYGSKFDWAVTSPVKCNGCINSNGVIFKPKQNNVHFALELFPSQSCKWISICFQFTEDKKKSSCKRQFEAQLLLDHGIVTTGVRRTAFPLDMKLVPTIRLERSKDTDDKITITNGMNERIVLGKINTKNIAMAFSSESCFDQAFKGLECLGDSFYIKTPTTVDKYPQQTQKNCDKGTDTSIRDDVVTTTEPSINLNDSDESQYNTTAYVTLPNELSNQRGAVLPPGSTGTEPSMKGWVTWAYFYGSLCGTLTGFLFAGVFFYFCRRSIYGNWYRGMYKRYGCDASGTTGGITGAEFGTTITGGNTTIGSTTAGATTGTTMGDTTASTSTGGSTSGATETKSMITM